MTNETQIDDIECPDEVRVTIKLGDKSAEYIISEVSAGKMVELISPLNQQDEAKKAQAQRDAQAKIISTCVKRGDGREITFAEAKAFRTKLTRELERHALTVNGIGKEAEEEAKNL